MRYTAHPPKFDSSYIFGLQYSFFLLVIMKILLNEFIFVTLMVTHAVKNPSRVLMLEVSLHR
jgi:hypothetical protein